MGDTNAGMDADGAASGGARASVVVPAHNEEARGFRVLPVLGQAAGELGWTVVVVCNDSHDRTAAMARGVPGVTVVEVDEPGKANALNLGDAHAGQVFPRIYLDADLSIDLDSLQRMVEVLEEARPLAVGPRIRYLTDGSPWLVRSYFEAVETIPFLQDVRAHHLEGRGVYGVNSAGRARFDEFPPLRADDTYFDRMFGDAEKETVDAAAVGIPVPGTLIEFLRSQTRTAMGSWEVSEWLGRHRPDRLVVSDVQSHPAQPLWRRIRHHLSGGGLMRDWRPHTVAITAAYLLVEAVARTDAAARRTLRRDVRWR